MIQKNMQIAHPPLQFAYSLPYGATVRDGGVQFSVFSRSANAMRVLLYHGTDDRDPSEIVEMNPTLDRWGDVWSVFVPGIGAGQLYHFQAEGPLDPKRGHRFVQSARLIDPYAKALCGRFLPLINGKVVHPPKCVVVDDTFDWQGDRHLKRNLSESIIYELHVKGFTYSDTSGVKNPGTYLGVIEKIPYLKSLGVTAIELMPVHEFPTNHWSGVHEVRPNYWGYDPIALFAPHRGYAAGQAPGSQVNEFKQMVRALHEAGIEVILDVVFNHTAEGNEFGPTFAFKGLENRVYYMLENGGDRYRNYSGCGNTVNGNHPIVRELIFHCLRYWVFNYHVDGFRFDLASILSRDPNGDLLPNPPVVESIAEDPLLADTKIIAEAWDAAGAYQVGTFANRRWAEWNGRYRDDVRRFWKGDDGVRGSLATRLAGSSDLYGPSGRRPYHSINFVTSHDGFTLHDLVSYTQKHNAANGENNADGDNNNYSDNCGIEGPSRRPEVLAVRNRQIRNFLTTLLLSHGVPMLVFGDECQRTQQGNNNAYCQDNSISWFDWSLVEQHADLVRFAQTLIHFRRQQPTVRRASFLKGEPAAGGLLPDVSWFEPTGAPVNWLEDERHALVCLYGAAAQTDDSQNVPRHLLLFMNASHQPVEFKFPKITERLPFRMYINTAAASPLDIFPERNGPLPPANRKIVLIDRSLVCYVSA